MRVADNFFDRKMDGGVLWQKIKRKMKLQQSLCFYGTRCIHVNDCTKRGTCGKTKHCIGENLQKNERLHFRKS